MKIRTEEDVITLDRKIRQELGVDIGKYRDEETIETLGSLLVFPMYVLSWTIRPVIVALLLYLFGFFLLDLVHIQYLLYGIIGLVLLLASGFFAGIFYLTIRFRSDIQRLMNYSMEILGGIVKDLDQLNTTTDGTNRPEVLKLLFLGVTHLITIPAISTIIGNRVPFFGRIVSGLVRRVLTRLSNLIRFDQMEFKKAETAAGGEGKILPIYLASVSGFHKFTDKVLGISLKVVQYPIGMVFAFFALLTWVFIWAIN